MKVFLRNIYFRIKNIPFVWRYFFNLLPRFKFILNRPKLSLTQSKILNDLIKQGIAITTVDDFFGNPSILPTLVSYITPRLSDATTETKKTSYKLLWKPNQPFDLENPFLKISLDNKVLDVINSYLGLWSVLKNYLVSISDPVGIGAPPTDSQRWHRDPEEWRICKMFIYLSDVDETSGPFVYIKESSWGKQYGHLFPQKPPAGNYPDPKEVESKIPGEATCSYTGRKGTIIFCDTTGLHRGGYATKKDRIMFTAFYSAPSYKNRPWYTRPNSFNKNNLPPIVQHTLGY